LTETTAGLVDQGVLSAMSPNTWVVNVGRGAIIDEGALIQELQDRRLGGAVLDVVQTEPLPADSPLWTMPNVIVSPHMSGDVRGWQDALVEVFENNLRAWVQGEPLVNVVDKQAGYVRGITPSREVRPRASSPSAP
jgi:phosphoglycerate dehydrogenase-like enzyme